MKKEIFYKLSFTGNPDQKLWDDGYAVSCRWSLFNRIFLLMYHKYFK